MSEKDQNLISKYIDGCIESINKHLPRSVFSKYTLPYTGGINWEDNKMNINFQIYLLHLQN